MKFRATFAVLVFLLLWQLGSWLYQHFAPSPNLQPHPDYEVVLFSVDPCRSCDQARQLLQEQQVPFFEHNLHQSEEGLRKFEALVGWQRLWGWGKGGGSKGINGRPSLRPCRTEEPTS